jgi:TRAP-type C4-dicarboxylate transport system permease small subunit
MSTNLHVSGRVMPATTSGLSLWRRFAQLVEGFNILTGYLSAVVIVVASLIIVYGVAMRYAMDTPLDWGLELSIFMLVIATFMSAAYTQLKRGHVTIEVMDHILSPHANRLRYLVSDILSLVFCAFVAWNAWTFFHEAFEDGRVTNSTWAPKLWIPYVFMALGLSALSLQLIVQIGDSVGNWRDGSKEELAEGEK